MKNNNNHENWIFLRGLVRGQYHWHHFPSAFKKKFPQAHLFFVDLPGNGFNFDLSSPGSIEPMVDFLRDRFNPSLKPPYRLVSLSLGGMVTLNWCQRYPEEIASAVVINSSLANLSSWYERFSLKQVGNALRYITGSADSKEAAILAMTSRQPEQHEQVVAHWGELNQQYPTSFKNALMQLKAASRFKLQQRVKPPVLCINAAGDELVSPRCSEAIANLLKVPLYTHPKAGHDLSLDDPEWLAATIHTWSENLQKEEHQLHKTELI